MPAHTLHHLFVIIYLPTLTILRNKTAKL